jgi:YjbE family integral membrane protein
MDPFSAAFWLQLLEIVWIDVLLSGDNAVVIALACRSLPEGRRMSGMILGAGAAVTLRVAFTLFVVDALSMPFLKVTGGVLLLWIAFALAVRQETHTEITPAASLWSAVRIIAVADAVMSFDNMMAVAAAAKGSMILILLGLGLSIPLLVSGSTLVLSLLIRFPIFVWAGAALIGWIGGDLMGSDPSIAAWLSVRWPAFDKWDGPLGAALTIATAWAWRRSLSAGKPPP